MSYRVGDPIFTHKGQVGQVTRIDPDVRAIEYDVDEANAKEAFRHGYIKGMSVEARAEFNDVMDEVVGIEQTTEKIDFLQQKIQKMAKDIDPKKKQILGYLRAEMSHLMNSKNTYPRFYEIESDKLP